jgi:cell division protein FtsA
VLPTGGDHFTNDIAIGLRTPIPEAERIKRRYGCVLPALISDDEAIEVPTVGNRKPRLIKRNVLCEILNPRAREILSLVRQEVERVAEREEFPAGIVLTGGGSELEGLVDIAETVFEAPARKGVPTGIGEGLDVECAAAYATCSGLVLYGTRNGGGGRPAPARNGSVAGKIRSWFAEMF